MPASSARVAVGTIAALLLGLAGLAGLADWRWGRLLHVAQHPQADVTRAPHPSASRTPAEPTSTPAPAGENNVASSTPRAVVPERGQHAPRPQQASSAPDQVAAPAAKASAAEAAVAPPSFDIVRVEPSGDALLAGRSRPNATVTLVTKGKVVAETKADAGGNFVMTPPALKPGDYAFALREGQGAAARESRQSVVVSVPASKKQEVIVALAEPGQATKLLSAPPEASGPAAPAAMKAATAMETPTAPPTAPGRPAVPSRTATSTERAKVPPAGRALAIQSVELENGSGLLASGVAPPGTDVRVYLNNSRVADVKAAAGAGAWTLMVRKGLSAGHYAVRADALKPNRTVASRVEVPFDVPEPMSVKAASRQADPQSGAPSSADASVMVERSVAEAPATAKDVTSAADAVLDEIKTELVGRGDSLWRISRKRLGHGTRYTQIFAANAAQIRNPALIYPGQVFVLPTH